MKTGNGSNIITSIIIIYLLTEDRSEKNQRLGWLRQVIDRQKEEEVKRQKEMEMLFSEEAEKMWNKQEAIWNREEDARKKLMDDVLDGLKEQTRSKLQGRLRIYTIISTIQHLPDACHIYMANYPNDQLHEFKRIITLVLEIKIMRFKVIYEIPGKKLNRFPCPPTLSKNGCYIVLRRFKNFSIVSRCNGIEKSIAIVDIFGDRYDYMACSSII